MSILQPANWVKTLLDNNNSRQQLANARFKEFDANGNGVLEWTELCNLTASLCEQLGIAQPDKDKLQIVYDRFDKNHDGVLSEPEFQAFFKVFLKSTLVQAEQAEADADARYIADREAATKAEEERQAARDAVVQEECNKRITAFSGTLAIATFGVFAQFAGNIRHCSLVFESLAAAEAHGKNPGPRGPVNLKAWQVKVTNGKCDKEADTDLVVAYLRDKFKTTVEKELA